MPSPSVYDSEHLDTFIGLQIVIRELHGSRRLTMIRQPLKGLCSQVVAARAWYCRWSGRLYGKGKHQATLILHVPQRSFHLISDSPNNGFAPVQFTLEDGLDYEICPLHSPLPHGTVQTNLGTFSNNLSFKITWFMYFKTLRRTLMECRNSS